MAGCGTGTDWFSLLSVYTVLELSLLSVIHQSVLQEMTLLTRQSLKNSFLVKLRNLSMIPANITDSQHTTDSESLVTRSNCYFLLSFCFYPAGRFPLFLTEKFDSFNRNLFK